MVVAIFFGRRFLATFDSFGCRFAALGPWIDDCHARMVGCHPTVSITRGSFSIVLNEWVVDVLPEFTCKRPTDVFSFVLPVSGGRRMASKIASFYRVLFSQSVKRGPLD